MPARKLQAPKGTFDVVPFHGERRRSLERLCEDVLGGAGYAFVETPVIEDTELFARGVGETTDIVQKEMFTFQDAAGRSLTLRPEGTAGVCRAYVEHGLHKSPQPVKGWYWGPFFRREAPQAGRYRQFTQVGAEALGSDDPSLDAEVVLLLAELLERAGVRRVDLRLSSLGSPATRREYAQDLRGHLAARRDELSEDVRARLDTNPLRAFDSDHPGTRAALEDAPRLLDRLAPEDAEHFSEVRALLDDAGLDYGVDATLVRGLDYYTRTVFEFTSPDLGAQSGVGGGGRYDGLVEQLGGPATPGVGWAAGVERILLASSEEAERRRIDVYVVMEGAGAGREAFRLRRDLRAAGITAEMEQAGRSLKGQLRHADRIGARHAVIVGRDGLVVRDLETGEQREATSRSEAVALASGGAA